MYLWLFKIGDGFSGSADPQASPIIWQSFIVLFHSISKTSEINVMNSTKVQIADIYCFMNL